MYSYHLQLQQNLIIKDVTLLFSFAKENKNVLTAVTLDPREGIATSMLEKCSSKKYYNTRPDATTWAKIAVPYILNIPTEVSGKRLTVPKIIKTKDK